MATALSRPNRKQRNFVPALTERQSLPEPPVTTMVMPGVDTSAVYTSHPGAEEQTSAQDRARGFVIRHLQLYIYEFLLGLTIALLAAMLGDVSAILFAIIMLGIFALTAIPTHIILNWQDYEYSRNGVERYRIRKAAEVARHETDRRAELNRAALEAWQRQLEARRRAG